MGVDSKARASRSWIVKQGGEVAELTLAVNCRVHVSRDQGTLGCVMCSVDVDEKLFIRYSVPYAGRHRSIFHSLSTGGHVSDQSTSSIHVGSS